MYKSLETLIKAHRYPTAEAARERVLKAYPRYLTASQFNSLLQLIADEYGEATII